MALFASIFLVLPVASRVQAETIGVLLTNDIPYYREMHDAFVKRLKSKGLHSRLKYLLQKPSPNPVSWRNASRKLIAADVDLIVTYGTAATLAVFNEKSGIQLIYSGLYGPLSEGLKKRSATGSYFKLPVTSAVRYLRATTQISQLGVVYSTHEEDSLHQLKEIIRLSKKYDFSVVELNLKNAANIAGLLADWDMDAIIITSSSIASTAFPTIIRTTRHLRIPTATFLPYDGMKAAITLSADPVQQGEIAADKAFAILNGQPAKEVPPSKAEKINLIFNLRDVRAMGLKIPMGLVTGATEVIY